MDSSTSSLTVTATSSMLFMVSPHALDLDASVSNSLPTTTNGFSDAVRSILTRARICFEGRQSTRRRRRRWERRRFAIWTLIWQRRRKSCDERTIGGTLKGSSTLDGLRFGPPHDNALSPDRASLNPNTSTGRPLHQRFSCHRRLRVRG
ncbi:hypothetical protein ARMSODRAFT_169953 [Armillaria solidipes]|uniref:Uncharacterized protein n=1 Tax=Armillaria solidipes TaxID=1076256 RepID=A0A2H3ATJ4_9AGAR|nr:hypothetical protein ARMSODRAFT_169953 [Armillaria solidipes]